MKNNIDKYRMLYLEKEKCIYSILLSILLYLFIYIVLNNTANLRDIVLQVIYLIGACMLVLLCQAILNISKKPYYMAIRTMHIFMAMFCMFKIVPIKLIHLKFLLILRSENLLDTVYMQTLAIMFFVTLNYVDNKDKKNINNIAMRSATLLFLINYFAALNDKKVILIINNILTLVILFYELCRFSECRLRSGNRINVIKLLINFDIVVVMLVNIILIAPDYMLYIKAVKDIVRFTMYIFLIISIIYKLINRPYRLLFADLYKENLEMDILNGKVVKKNRELEFSQAIIRKKEKMFKTFFISVPIPLVMISKNGRILFANSSFQKLIEEDNIKNIINKKISRVINIIDDRSIDDLIEAEGKEINGIIPCKDEEKYVDIDIMEVADQENQALMILNDVTARVKIGKLRTDMENNKFQERIKSDFLSNISHDLKTPINVIYSASQLVTMFIKKNDKKDLEKYNMICKLNCFTLIRLTNNLIDSSRIYSDFLSPSLQMKNIVEIVEEIVMSLVDYVKSKNIELVFDTDEEEIYVNIDEEFMQRIIMNLVSNAIKFTNENGRIEVIIHNEEDKVIVSVKDNGEGMEKEFIENAFKRYSMGKNNSDSEVKGTGIGLFVVKKLVEKQNGSIEIKSKVNIGTEVEMVFNKEN